MKARTVSNKVKPSFPTPEVIIMELTPIPRQWLTLPDAMQAELLLYRT